MGRAHFIALCYEFEDLLFAGNELLHQPLDLDLLLFVFKQFKLLVIVKQVINLATVDLVHRHGHREVATRILPVVNASIEQISHSELLKPLHCKCLSRARLAIGKYCDGAGVENEVQNGTDRTIIELSI